MALGESGPLGSHDFDRLGFFLFGGICFGMREMRKPNQDESDHPGMTLHF